MKRLKNMMVGIGLMVVGAILGKAGGLIIAFVGIMIFSDSM